MKIKDIFTRQTEIGEHTRTEFLNLGGLAMLLVAVTEGYKSLKWGIPPIENPGQLGIAFTSSILGGTAFTLSGGIDHEDQPIPRHARITNVQGDE